VTTGISPPLPPRLAHAAVPDSSVAISPNRIALSAVMPPSFAWNEYRARNFRFG
jgi:hypothetical protein